MSVHDYSLSNQSGASFRSDLNNALAAIVSNNSNSSEPATMYAYQWWADTSNAVMKIRNSANDGWIELFQLDGTITLEDGSASTPALAFRDDLNTGIFSSAADTFNVATAGTERMELGATTIFNESGADVDFRIEGDTDANLFVLDASADAIGIGAAPATTGMKMEISRSTTDAFVNASDCVLRLLNTDTSANTNQTSLQFTTSSTGSGADSAIVSQAEDASGNSRLEFWTDTGNGMTEKASIDSTGDLTIADGDLVIGTSGHGIDFSATGGPTNGTGTSELLDDYEEGTFTYTHASGGQVIVNSTGRSGSYVKIGNMVHVWGQFATDTSGNYAAGTKIRLHDLPFNSNSTLSPNAAGIITVNFQTTHQTSVGVVHISGTNELHGTVTVTSGHSITGSGHYFQVSYIVA